MALKICRLCLSTDKRLQELNENLLDYFQDMCDYASGFSKHLCCSICKDALKKNLDFRNKCLKSNKILQEWKRNKTRNKPSFDSLHKLLYDFIDDTKTSERNKLTKCKNYLKGSNKTTKSVTDNVISYSGNSDEEITTKSVTDNVNYSDEEITTNTVTDNVISYSGNSDEEIITKSDADNVNYSDEEITTYSVTDNVVSYSGNSDEEITTKSVTDNVNYSDEEITTYSVTDNVISYSENSDEEMKSKSVTDNVISYSGNSDEEITTNSVTDNVISYSGNSDEKIKSKSVTDNVISYSGNSDEEIKVEIKDEMINDDTFEVNICRADHVLNNRYEINNEFVKDEIEIKNDENYIFNDNTQPVVVNETVNDKKGMENDIFNDTGLRIRIQLDADNKILIDCVDAKENKLKKVSKTETIEIQEQRVYPRKGLSEYSQYEEVFDIQLFTTDDDARREFLQRRTSEPYVSAKYRCELCYTVYKCDKLLQFHMRWHDPYAEFECDICGMTFAARKSVLCHKAASHRGRFACKICPLVTYYSNAMEAHFHKHKGKLFKCHCNRVFKHISTYFTHRRTAHVSTHVCVTCARTFVSEQGLLIHRVRVHQSHSKVDVDGTSRCEPCGLTFATRQVYNVHVLNTDKHEDAAKDMIACSSCGLSFDNAAQLKSHKRQYHPARKRTNDMIKCKMCGAEGKGRVWRWRHYEAEHPQVSYLDEVREAKKHMCDQCGKRFCNITALKDHMNSHLGLKPYTCTRCPKTFSSSAARARHAEHHAPPSRACGTCGARFRSAANLCAHMRSHIGIRRYACVICSKAFLHSASLREHVRGVHQHIRRVRGQARGTPRAE